MHKEAYLQQALSDDSVRCQTCEHFCAVQAGQTGKCGVRRNVDGTLYLVVYGCPVAVHVDPIEKKPLFHFLPGSDALSIGTYGCNFRCPFCQNWQMSQTRDVSDDDASCTDEASPEALVDLCTRRRIPIIAYTYNEPTVFFEYTYDTARLAHEQGLKNVYVSNGFMSLAALDMLEPYLDGINVDLKAFSDAFYTDQCQARIAPVKRNIQHIARETDIWIEITTLLIPGLNDSDAELAAIANWLADVDLEMPWHVSAFHPDFRMADKPSTLPSALSRAYEIGKSAGLKHVYVGNITDTDRESTYCPSCGAKLILRQWFSAKEAWDEPGVCLKCGYAVTGVWS
jgi:pyruvate formate lyase activating enzyme